MPSSVPATSRWHDHTVATAAAAWLRDPRDYVAYQHLVAAVDSRNAFLNPQLCFPPDSLSVARDPQPVGATLTGDPVELLHRLRDGGA